MCPGHALWLQASFGPDQKPAQLLQAPWRGGLCSPWRLLQPGRAPRRAGSAWERAFKVTAASWEGQPLRGQAWGWAVVGRKGTAFLGQKGSRKWGLSVRWVCEE